MATNTSNENNCISNQNQRKLSDLRVFELRSELQKRNEDSTGVKAVLVSRLSFALEKEGRNPEEYLFIIETTKKNVARRAGTSVGKTTTKEDADSDASEVLNDGQEMSDSLNENDISIDESVNMTEKTCYEASDIIEDALQLAVDDELKEDREDMSVVTENRNSSKVNINSSRNEVNSQKFPQDEAGEDLVETMLSSPPKPETAPVMVPLTVEDTINMDTSKQRKTATDDASLIVNIDDTQSDVLDPDLDFSNNSTSASVDNERNSRENNSETKSSNNDFNNSGENKTGNANNSSNSANTEDANSSNTTKEHKDSENKDSSSKSKSSNATKDSKAKNKDSKNVTSGQKVSQNNSNGRNIWVSGLSQSTKASELQLIFSKHGKVVSAKIIKNARMSGSRCYGFITMENSEQVTKCIAQLNKTELHGRAISLSRNRPQENQSKPTVSRSKPTLTKRDNSKKSSTKASDSKKESVKDEKETNKESKTDEKADENTKAKKSEEKDQNKTNSENGTNENKEKRKPIRAPVRERGGPSFRRPVGAFRRSVPLRRPFVQNTGPSFRGFRRTAFSRGGIRAGMPIKRVDVDRNIRERERERLLREERRRREELFRAQRDLEREERIRFEREKERLKLERMKLEREKAEFFRYERERAKLEREKIEREREELRRRQQSQIPTQHRVEESRSRSAIVSSTINKRPFETRDIRGNDPYWEERKRIQQVQRMESNILPGRQTYVDSNTAAGNRHISHTYENRNDSYKRGRIDLAIPGSNSRSEFDSRRHDSRHGSGHDRDERKSGSGPSGSYSYRDSSRGTSFQSRDRRMSSQRDEWKTGHDSRRDRYSDKPLTGGSTAGFGGTSRSYAGGDSRSWSDRNTNSLNKVSYGSGNVHISDGQPWSASSGDRWNSAIGSSSETRSRGQPSLNSSLLSGPSPLIADIFASNPMGGIGLNMSHSLGGSGGSNSMGAGDRPYLHSNRRF